MATQKIDPSPRGNKTRSALGNKDMRIGIGGTTKGTTINGFNPNPFKNGGSQEQRFADSDLGGVGGPKSGKAPKPERIISTTDDKVMRKQGGGD